MKGGLDSSTPTSKQETAANTSVPAEDIENELIGCLPTLVAMLRPYIPENSNFPLDENSMKERIAILLWNLRLTMQQEFPDGIPLGQESAHQLSQAFSQMEVKYPHPIDEYLLPPLIEQVIIMITERVPRS
jgi:hypothetical protein